MRPLLACLVLSSTSALAWDSVCFESAGRPCAPSSGPTTARHRWLGPSDEHRQLFEETRQRAGLPSSVSAETSLTVFTNSTSVDLGGTLGPTLQPGPFEAATRQRTRTFTIAELAQLPDFSYALWDWAGGHETCPIQDGTDPTLCHDFASHMGPVNSNHFVPQAQQAYTRAHRLALARAAECKTLGDALGGRFPEVPRACEVEALSLEAMGQHFLQDAWSMGHMWQRWGSSNLSDFPGATTEEKRDRAVLTALVSGFIHGARGVLQALPSWTSYDVNDAMCAPWDDVRFLTKDGLLSQGTGDLYLAQMTADQRRRFDDCATSGLLEVYRATAMTSGALGTPATGLRSVDPTGEGCFGQRATNEAIVRGMAIQVKVLTAQTTVPLDARFSSWMVPQVARASGKVPVAKKTKNEFRFSLERVTTMARLHAKDDPTGTQLAEGGLGSFMGVSPNGGYGSPASFEDPPLPWAPDSTDPKAVILARAFHVSHAKDWCGVTTTASLDALRTHARDVTLDSEAKLAACAACAELVSRHVRIGTASNWDTTNEPLCQSLVPNPPYLYLSGSGTQRALAEQWCCQ